MHCGERLYLDDQVLSMYYLVNGHEIIFSYIIPTPGVVCYGFSGGVLGLFRSKNCRVHEF